MSMLARFAASGAGLPTYVDDVFSTYLYTGNGSTQTITNGIDLATQGGLVWIKARSVSHSHFLFDTARGANAEINSNTSDASTTLANSLTAFNSNGFSVGSAATAVNTNNELFVSWTFRKAAKFFDVVTYTGNNSNRTIAHNLGVAPGCIIIKAINSTSSGFVYSQGLANDEFVQLAGTGAKQTSTTIWNNTAPTAANFSLGNNASTNTTGTTYVAYLFAHDTAADGLIQCGSFTTDGSGNASVSLGWEPQWVLERLVNGTGSSWSIVDSVRGLTVTNTDNFLEADSSTAEYVTGTDYITPNATGFSVAGWPASSTLIYIAIRRPNKPPTTGTQVFQPVVYTGTNVDNRLVDTTIAPDMVWVRQRDDTVLGGMVIGDRLRGQPYLLTGATAAEVDDANAFDKQLVGATEYGTAFSSMTGFFCGNDATAKLNASTTASNQIAEAFKRAPGFFDVVCYTGTGSARTVNHNLGVAPELMIVKGRSLVLTGNVYCANLSGAPNNSLYLFDPSLGSSAATGSGLVWNSTAPTSTQFTVNYVDAVNRNGDSFVAYLFASLPGVSKVGSYTGNGTSQTINCGFATGARFILIKRTDSAGDWYVWDTARGIVAANDPRLSLNTSAAEVTTDDSIDPDNSGFVVNQVAATNVNVSSATYIYLAIA